MNREIDKLRQMLARRIAEAGTGSFYGEVVKVDEGARTCDVQTGGIVREGVLLYFIDDAGKKGWWFVPAKGSMVLVSRVDAAGTRLRVSMFSEVDKIVCTIGDAEFVMTGNGYKLNRGSSGLLGTLTDLCTALEQLTVSTVMGPSGPPINIAAITKIKQDLSNYLEG